MRFDGNYYYYKSADETLFASMNNSNTKMTGTGEPYQYIGWYRGTNSAGAAMTSVSNGAISKALNLNTTISTHIPKIRLIVSLRLEASLYSYRKALSELDGAVRGIALESQADYMGTPFNSDTENKFIAIYPEYYSTWDNPDERIPFAEKFLWAKDNDATLYNDLCNLVVKSNTPYTMNPAAKKPELREYALEMEFIFQAFRDFDLLGIQNDGSSYISPINISRN